MAKVTKMAILSQKRRFYVDKKLHGIVEFSHANSRMHTCVCIGINLTSG